MQIEPFMCLKKNTQIKTGNLNLIDNIIKETLNESIDTNIKKMAEKNMINLVQLETEKNSCVVDNIVSTFSNDDILGYDEVKKYYGLTNQKNIVKGNLFFMNNDMTEEINEIKIKISRKKKIADRLEKQKNRIVVL